MSRREPTKLEMATAIKALNEKWKPHPGQVPVGKALFQDMKKRIFLSIGRQWGKTSIAIYFICRWAATHPGDMCYYFGPKQKQVEDIMWRRIINMVPMELVEKIMQSKKEIIFKNGAVIHVRGSDDPELSRGLTPHFAVYEEYKDFKPYVHDDIIGPALAARGGTLLVIGTPPDQENFFTELADQFKNGDPEKYAYFEGATLDNPYNDREAVLEEIERLKRKGEFAKVWREYFGKFVPGGSSSVFPMFSPEAHVKPHDQIMNKIIKPDAKRFDWILMTDPGTTTVFGALFVAIHPYTKHVYILDEIYETDRLLTSTSVMWGEMQRKAADLYPQGDVAGFHDWTKGYDQAAAWFASEMSYNYGVNFVPTDKINNKKQAGISLIKDLLLMNLITISDRCENTIKEISRYQTNERGEFIKKNDHCFHGDTLILTDKGQVPIKDINLDHKVLTRKGFRNIVKIWDNGIKPIKKAIFDDGSELLVTEDHKIYTINRGFVELKNLKESDQCIKVKEFKSNIMVSNSEDTLKQNKSQIEYNTEHQLNTFQKELVTYTDLYTKQRLDRSLRDMKSTTKMKIQKIIQQVILKLFQEKNTKKDIKIEGVQRLCGKTLTLLDILPKNGMLLKLAKTGIVKIAGICGLIWNGLQKTVLSVIKNTKHQNQCKSNQNTVIKTVRLLHLEDVEKARVYDLTIDQNHEYFANSILVHNCIDCIRYVLAMMYYNINQAVPPTSGPAADAPRRRFAFKTESNELEEAFKKFNES